MATWHISCFAWVTRLPRRKKKVEFFDIEEKKDINYLMDNSKSQPRSKILFCFVGNRDPFNPEDQTDGPILSLLSLETFHEAYLFCTGEGYFEKAKMVEKTSSDRGLKLNFQFINLEVLSVVDYEEIYEKLAGALAAVTPSFVHRQADYYILLDPGTPQMQTVWFLLSQSGTFPATLLQGVPPEHGAGLYKVKEVELGRGVLPRVRPFTQPEQRSKEKPPTPAESRVKRGSKWIQPDEIRIDSVSPKVKAIVKKARNVANYDDVSVLLLGETGTGKEIFARLIHREGPRKNQLFHTVNCAAFSPQLIESTLFGHKKGAYTGAETDRLGIFRTAEGGTVFLDEIGELPLALQPKLLRVLEQHSFFPLGDDREVQADVRILAATNQDLLKKIEEGSFRGDLYQRLNQVSFTLPPLRERPEDIRLLSEFFLEEWNSRYHEEKDLSQEVMDLFMRYSWPGNIRELRNTVIHLCSLSDSDGPIGPALLPESMQSLSGEEPEKAEKSSAPFPSYDAYTPSRLSPSPCLPEEGTDIKEKLHTIEEGYFREALKKTGGNKSEAAKLLAMKPPAFRKALRERFPDLE